MSKFTFIGLIIVVSTFLCSPCGAATYSVQALGIASGYGSSEAMDINNAGIVVCWAVNAYDTGGVFVWSAEKGIENLSGYGVSAFAGINNLGQTTGVYTDTNPNLRFEPLIRNADGTETRIHIPDGVSNAWVRKILDDSSVYAMYEYGDADRYVIAQKLVVVSATGETCYIELPSESISSIVASNNGLFVINNRYLWTVADGLSTIPFLESEENVDVKCISNSGWIAGVQNGTLVRWDNVGNKQSLGAGDAMDINITGQIVGSIKGQAAMWDMNGSITYLPILDGYSYSTAAAINDNGWIAGSTWYNGQATEVAVLWKPVPEPTSLLALAVGLGSVGVVIRRKRS